MILLVDDDSAITTSLALLLKQNGFQTIACDRPQTALEGIRSNDVRLVIQDMNFSRQTTGEEGLKLLKAIKTLRPELPVILVTAWGTIELAVEGMRSGASDFVTKPWTSTQLLQSVRTALSLAGLQPSDQKACLKAREVYDQELDLGGIIGESESLLKIIDVISKVSQTDASVLITGESGTGKELVAEVLHRNSHRRAGPFIKVNLGGISQSLFESEMFGHVKGAFTDARNRRQGRFELADGGSIFLDEIGDLGPASQVKLLRVLQDRTFEVLGSSTTRSVDIRVISATNRSLSEMVKLGQFREDLFYRLNLITIQVPALRQRVSDIPLLARHFLQRALARYSLEHCVLSAEALDWLQQLAWPGNIRQLSQLVERTALISRKSELEASDFKVAFEMEVAGPDERLPEVGSMSLNEVEKLMIVKALKHYDGQVSQAAASLGLSRPAIYRRIEKYGIKV
ncbi:MAG: sigma-54-dependent Fis family transcriptional regulator [Acidobacteriota bacterium]|nr:MAG: sigma-54-dependent Fis family transcriptional regulator [Acidobacteriota bacterium]